MSQAKKPEWSNDPKAADDPPKTIGEEIEEEMRRPTPRELHLAALAERMKGTKPQSYNVTSKNKDAMRVIHDVYGDQVSIPPETTKTGVMLWPHTAEYLGKGDLTVTASTAA
jgi:hypothetical protein